VRLLPLLLLLLGTLALPAPAASSPRAQAPERAPAAPTFGPSGFTLPPGASVYGLRTRDAVLLGVIEGVTEYLPVSSTGHLIIASRVLRLDSQQPVLNALGEPVWHQPPERGRPGELLTQKLATDTYIVIIQVGALLAVALLYWRQLWSMVLGACGRDPAGLRLLVCVGIAFVPSAALGYLFHDWIDEHLYSIDTVIVMLVLGALLMFYAEYWYGRQLLAGTRVEREELNVAGAMWVGLLQCAALLPGTSRPMMTIVAGYFAGLDPRRATEFSFILGFVTLSAASLYKSLKGGAAMIDLFGWSDVLVGAAVAAVTAAACLRLLVICLMRYGLAPFAWYRLALAAALWSLT
jgi:undecaprenyl-diphosphatase